MQYITPGVATPPYWSFAGGNQSGSAASPLCHDPQTNPALNRDSLINWYGVNSIFDVYYDYGKIAPGIKPRFTPNCFELAGAGSNAPQSANFNFQAISTNHTWALIKYPLVAPASIGYGLDRWLQVYQQRYGSVYGSSSRTITSGYRTPSSNANVGAQSSRHMFGDAIDFASATDSLDELNAMNDAALRAQADFVEDPAKLKKYCANPNPVVNKTTGHVTPPYPCAHADWRLHDKGKYVY